MTVDELRKRLSRFPKNAEVFILPDELECDDEGFNTDLHRISEVVHQEIYVETNTDFTKITEVMLKFEPERACSNAKGGEI